VSAIARLQHVYLRAPPFVRVAALHAIIRIGGAR